MNIFDRTKLEQTVGYTFKNKDLLFHAMRHSSYSNENGLGASGSNERLEFLGDAVLELASSEFIFTNFSDMPEGEMTRLRASIVCEQTLAICARAINLPKYIILGKGEETSGGRERDSIVSDAFEALIGAIYEDGGFTNAKEFVYRFIMNDIDNKKLFFDSKTILQEMVQTGPEIILEYNLIREEGPAHNKKFTMEAVLNGKSIGVGFGRTKKHAEQSAAYEAIKKLKGIN